MRESCDVAVVGGGPVGLFMGLALAGRGLCVKVLERSTTRHAESRAIGIHPPGLKRHLQPDVLQRPAQPILHRTSSHAH